MTSGHEQRTLAVNGFDLYVEIRGEGKPLLLLHGFTGCGADWSLIFPEPPPGFRTITPDLRGHGHSTNPSGQFSHRQAAADMLALLDALAVDRCCAIGLSSGGHTLLHMARQQPRRFEAMVLVSAAHYFPEQARAEMANYRIETLTEEQWRKLRQRHHYGDEQIRALYLQGHGFKDRHDDMNLSASDLGAITARTLIVYGDHDALFPVGLAIEQYESIPHASLRIVPDSGHLPVFGPHAAWFAETAIDYLERAHAQAPADSTVP